MIHAAHASRYHWSQVGTKANLARGEWQVSRVTPCSTVRSLRSTTRAAASARRQGDGIEDWDSHSQRGNGPREGVAGNRGVRALRADGARSGEGIADDEDRDHLLSELGTLPGR